MNVYIHAASYRQLDRASSLLMIPGQRSLQRRPWAAGGSSAASWVPRAPRRAITGTSETASILL